jgi:hypothetical protein
MDLLEAAEKSARLCGRPQSRQVTTAEGLPATGSDTRYLPISAIRKDGQTQHRVAINLSIIAEYASLMREGVVFPPVRVWWDGVNYWLSDGFQRVAAAETAGRTQIAAEVFHGSLSDAQWDSYAANATHGSPRGSAETQAVIRLAFQHSNSAKLSNVEIAKHLHLSVATVRRGRNKVSSSHDQDSGSIVNRGKATYLMATARIGKGSSARRAGKSRRDLRTELADMQGTGSPNVRRLLNIIGHWVRGEVTPTVCLDGIERFVQSCNPSVRAPQVHPLPPTTGAG